MSDIFRPETIQPDCQISSLYSCWCHSSLCL